MVIERFRLTMARLIKILVFSVALAIVAQHAAKAEYDHRPKTTFLHYMAALYWAKDVKDFNSYLVKDQRVALNRKEGDERRRAIEQYKRGYVTQCQFTKEIIDGDVATLEGKGKAWSLGQVVNADFSARLLKQDGEWKIQYSGWSGLARPMNGL